MNDVFIRKQLTLQFEVLIPQMSNRRAWIRTRVRTDLNAGKNEVYFQDGSCLITYV